MENAHAIAWAFVLFAGKGLPTPYGAKNTKVPRFFVVYYTSKTK